MTLREAIEQNDVASLDDLLLEEPNRIEGDAECITPFQIVHELAMGKSSHPKVWTWQTGHDTKWSLVHGILVRQAVRGQI